MFFRRKTKKTIQYPNHILAKKIIGRGGRSLSSKPSWRFILGKILYLICLLAFIGGTLYILFFSSLVAIKNFAVAGNERIDQAALKEAINSEISGKYADFLPKNSIILANKTAIADAIIGKFKIIKSVAIKKNFPDELSVKVSERELGLVFCASEQCYVVDAQGQVFSPADFGKNELYEDQLVRFYDDGNKPVRVGDMVLNAAHIKYVLDAQEEISEQINIRLEKEVRTPQLASGDIRMKTADGWMVYFDEAIPVVKEVEMLKIVLNEKITKERWKDLEYVDLRTDNKVYYKFKNSDQEQQDSDPKTDAPGGDQKGDNKKPKNT